MLENLNELQRATLLHVAEFARPFPCIKAVHIFGSVARGATVEANDIDLFFEYADGHSITTEHVATFTDFQDKLENWRQAATKLLGKPVKPCCTWYGQPDIDIWEAIKNTKPIAVSGKAFLTPTPAVRKA